MSGEAVCVVSRRVHPFILVTSHHSGMTCPPCLNPPEHLQSAVLLCADIVLRVGDRPQLPAKSIDCLCRFLALLGDVFPSVPMPEVLDEEMSTAIKAAATELQLELLPEQVGVCRCGAFSAVRTSNLPCCMHAFRQTKGRCTWPAWDLTAMLLRVCHCLG